MLAVRINDWWSGDATERLWMETTGRDDLGVDLHAPQLNGAGKLNGGTASSPRLGRATLYFTGTSH